MGADQKTSVWTPLKNPLFRDLWIGAIFSSIATWIHNVAAAWLMLMLTTSPLMVGLLNAAASFPYLILSLPAGALADMADRRRLLLFTHGWMLAVAALLGSLTILVGMTAWGLLTFTLLLGLGSALNLPAWEAIDSEILPLSEIPKSAALDNVALNLTLAVGPALGG